MSQVTSLGISGILTAHSRLRESAHRVATHFTDELESLPSATANIADGLPPRPVRSGDDTSLAREFVDQELALHQAAASARVITTANEMEGALLDIFA